jgi:signal transduction histidine kinase
LTRRIVIWTLAGLIVVAGVVATSLYSPDDLPWMAGPAVSLLLGALIETRAPGNVVGRLMMAFGASTLISGVSTKWLDLSAPLAGWADAIADAINTAGVLLLPFIMLRFPDGRPLTRRWLAMEWIVISAMVIGATAALLNGGWGGDSSEAPIPSPLQPVTAPWGGVASNIFFVLLIPAMAGAAASVIVRYRRARREERQQLKWLVFSGGVLVVALAAVNIEATGWEVWLMGGSFTLVPIAVGIAVLRYRLYDIDLVINRTVLFVLLAAFITILYATVTVALSNIGDFGSSIAATAVIALAFEPFRHRAQRWADRVAYGKRANPYEVLSDLTQRLAGAESAYGLLDRTARRLADGTGAERAVVWVAESDSLRPIGWWPENQPPVSPTSWDDLPGHVVPIETASQRLGALTVEKHRGDALTPTEHRLVDDLAGSAASVLTNLALQNSLTDRAEELASSRRRLMEVQNLERRRMERGLDEGAQQLVVSLKVKLNVASRLAHSEGTEPLAQMLDGMSTEAQQAINQIRSLARGLYPALLEAEGLVAAVRSIAEVASVPVDVHADEIGEVPAELEAAVFFCISEAITNATKHGGGKPVRVTITRSEGELQFEVSDEGPGFDQSLVQLGSGLKNMSDRIDAVGGTIAIKSKPGQGTRIQATVPLEVDQELSAVLEPVLQ